MPERILGNEHPWRRAALIMIVLSIVVVGLAAVNVTLVISNGRQNDQLERQKERLDAADNLRESEAKAAKARAASECRARIAGTKQANDLLEAMRDLAQIPQTNLQTYLNGELTEAQRANYEDALMRYQNAEKRFHAFRIPTCIGSDP